MPGEGLQQTVVTHSVRAAEACADLLSCVLQYVPVDTIICFRASCPIVIAVIEFLYLGRELPSFRSWASLLGEMLASFLFNWLPAIRLCSLHCSFVNGMSGCYRDCNSTL